MNNCYLLGQVYDEPFFEFLYDSTYISVSSFTLRTPNNDFIHIIGYDDMADYVYRYINIGQNIFIEGCIKSINNTLFVKIVSIEKIKKNRNIL